MRRTRWAVFTRMNEVDRFPAAEAEQDGEREWSVRVAQEDRPHRLSEATVRLLGRTDADPDQGRPDR